ncbi:unnamed protein product [Amoebophrya sp. A25]|nr:unnamed protein product [Amoebophrya sp. A25]|eukprot:GSA25T00002664001.1
MRPASPSFHSTRCIKCNAPLELVNDLPGERTQRREEDFELILGTSSSNSALGGHTQEGGSSSSTFQGLNQAPSAAPASKEEIIVRIERILALATGEETLCSAVGSTSGQQSTSGSADSARAGGVCDVCVSKVISEGRRQLQEVKESRRMVELALKQLEEEEESAASGSTENQTDPSSGALDRGSPSSRSSTRTSRDEEHILRVLGEQEKAAKQEVTRLKTEEDALLRELEHVDAELDQLREEENSLHAGPLASYQLDLLDHEDEKGKGFALVRYTKDQLEKLKRASVLNDVFHITCDGPFGCINTFRLGKLPDVEVSWDEINAAWGHTCLLLDVLAKKLRIPPETFSYKLFPRGNSSSLVENATGVTLELYGGEGSFARFYSGRRFDQAMCGFLLTVRQLAEWLHRRDASVRLPFRIEEGKIGGFKITLQFNEAERWTKALKFLLINLKWIVAFLESHEAGS